MTHIASRRTFLSACCLLALPAPAAGARTKQDAEVPYVPTPPRVVDGMLAMAGLKPGEELIDLGSGDGRIPIAAARRGAVATGVEIDSRLVTRARSLAGFAGLDPAPRFIRGDLFDVSLRSADVVTLYLLPQVNERLKPKLLTEMKPGARVVSHAFDMGDWPPDAYRSIDDKHVYLWIIPAIAGGEWRLTRGDGSNSVLAIEQRYSRVSGTLDGRPVAEARLVGQKLSFAIDGVRYQGIVGEREIRPDPSGPSQDWRAVRSG